MKRNNEFYFKIGMNGLLIVCGGIFFYYILFHTDRFFTLITSLFSILTPFIAGIAIAYILNPIMRFLENKVFSPLWNKIKRKKDHKYAKEDIVIRGVSAFLTLVFFVAVIYLVIMLLVPQVISSIQSIVAKVPNYFLNANEYYSNVLARFPALKDLIEQYNTDLSQWFYEIIIPKVKELVGKTPQNLLGSIVTIFKSLLNFIIGIIISLHLLVDKERFIARTKKVLYAYLKRERANNFINNLRYSDKIFGGFITGKVIDSVIIGILCYFGMMLLNLPYAVLISVIVGITNVIPYFGPFIGAIPSAFFILMIDPKKCLIFVLFILALQQFDGNILGPKILGDSTGLDSFWVIFSITVFSGLFGVIGMFIGVPVFAVIYAALKTMINKRLEIKHMPVSTSYYIDSDFLYEEDGITNSGQAFRFGRKAFDKVTKETIEDDEDRAALTAEAKKLIDEKDENTES